MVKQICDNCGNNKFYVEEKNISLLGVEMRIEQRIVCSLCDKIYGTLRHVT